MNVASLELCKELYYLTRWIGTDSEWTNDYHQNKPDGTPDWKWTVTRPFTFTNPGYNYPAYSLGYLLHKLPKRLKDGSFLQIDWSYIGSRDFCMGYMGTDDWTILVTAKKWHGLPDNEPNGHNEEYVKYMSLEDAAAKLVIELFKQGIFKNAHKN